MMDQPEIERRYGPDEGSVRSLPPRRPSPRTRHRRGALLATAIAVVVAVVTAVLLYATAERQRPVEVVAATVVGDSLVIEVDSCGGDPEITELTETAEEVRVTVEATTRPLGAGAECLDVVMLSLELPLDERLLIDGTTGRPVDVQRP